MMPSPESTPQLLERRTDIACLRDLTANSARGNGATIVVDGVPGVGKSALLELFASDRADGDAMLLRARGDELGRTVPHGVLQQLLRRTLAELGEDELATVTVSPAAPLLTALGMAPATGPIAPGQVANGLWWLLAHLADERPIIIVVDDLHWADAPSLEALAFLASRIDDLRVVVIAGRRSSEASIDEAAMTRLRTATPTTVVTLSPLSDDGAARLVRRLAPHADERTVERALEQAGGNPFLLTEYMRHVHEAGTVTTTVNVDAGAIPPRVLDDARRRFAVLDDSISRFAGAAAILGVRATIARAGAVASLEPSDAERCADELIAITMLERDGDAITFRHPLLRAASLATAVDVNERRALAGRAADVIARDGGDAMTVASLLLDAPIAGDVRTSSRLVDGAVAAIGTGAPADAIRFVDRAIAEPIEDPDARASAWVLSGQAHALTGDVPGALEQWQAALGVATDPVERSNLLAAIANVLVGASDLDGACRSLQAASDELIELPGHERRARMLNVRARAFGRFAGIAEFSDLDMPAVVPEDPADDNYDDRMLLASLATAHVFSNERADLARELGRRALAGMRLLEEESADGQALYVATGSLTWTDDYDVVLPVLDAAVADARRRGSVLGHASASFCRGGSLVRQGDLVHGAADLEAAIEARHDGWIAYLPYAGYYGSKAYLDIGDADQARALVAATVPGGDAKAWGPLAPFAHSALAVLSLADDDLDGALTHLLAGHGAVGRAGIGSVTVADWRQDALEIAARLGRGDEFRELAASTLADARSFNGPRPLGMTLRAVAAAVARDDVEALVLLDEAVEVLDAGGVRWELAKTLAARGEVRSRTGGDVVADYSRALELARECGGRPLAELMRAQLDELGTVVLDASTARGLLTPGELRVAELAATGMTNREIAQALFVTVKAIEWHLRHAYRKLDILGRRELAAALNR